MNYGVQWLLISAVAAVGVLHTIVPDHWVPITLLARQRGWTRAETARAALQAGTGHVVSTLVIALIVWLAGVAVAERFGHIVDTASSLALVAFGLWIGISAWRDLLRTVVMDTAMTFLASLDMIRPVTRIRSTARSCNASTRQRGPSSCRSSSRESLLGFDSRG
jgi:hypothetical protein